MMHTIPFLSVSDFRETISWSCAKYTFEFGQCLSFGEVSLLQLRISQYLVLACLNRRLSQVSGIMGWENYLHGMLTRMSRQKL